MAFGSAGWRTFLCVPPPPLCLRVEKLGVLPKRRGSRPDKGSRVLPLCQRLTMSRSPNPTKITPVRRSIAVPRRGLVLIHWPTVPEK